VFKRIPVCMCTLHRGVTPSNSTEVGGRFGRSPYFLAGSYISGRSEITQGEHVEGSWYYFWESKSYFSYKGGGSPLYWPATAQFHS
jgi:hypothetical protein